MLTELIAPNICIICRRPAIQINGYPGFCHQCLQRLPWRYNRARISCEGLTKAYPEFYRAVSLPEVYAACDYIGKLRRCLIELKFYGRTGMARPLAALLVNAAISQNLQFDAVAAVPLHSLRFRERGYNQAGLLAAQTADLLGCPDVSEIIVRVKNTERQSEQADRRARIDNLRNAFALDTRNCRQIEQILLGRKILLIDDVLTTGATMQEAARPLIAEGAVVICIAVASDHS